MTLVVGLVSRPFREVGLEEDAPVEQRHEIGIGHGEFGADQGLTIAQSFGNGLERLAEQPSACPSETHAPTSRE